MNHLWLFHHFDLSPPAKNLTLSQVVRRLSERYCCLPITVVPMFNGYERAQYQEHDDDIVKLVAVFNADKAGPIGATVD
jgi:hypothetical protein